VRLAEEVAVVVGEVSLAGPLPFKGDPDRVLGGAIVRISKGYKGGFVLKKDSRSPLLPEQFLRFSRYVALLLRGRLSRSFRSIS